MQKFIAICAFFAIVAVVHGDDPENFGLVRSETKMNEDGSYNWVYETADGTVREESGVLINPGTDDQIMKVTGSYKYLDPNGEEVSVQYTADENGFAPVGTGIAQAISDAALNAKNYIQPKSDIKKN